MNEPKNHPMGPRSDTARRPFAVFALVASLALAAAILVGCGNQQGSADPAAEPESSATGEPTAQPDVASTASSEKSAQEGRSEPETSASSVDSGPPTLGDEDAPVTMVEYADYQ